MISMPNMGLELGTLRSGVACFTDWANQALASHCCFAIFFSFLSPLRKARMSSLAPKIKHFQENTGVGMLLGFTPTAPDCDLDNLIVLTRIYFVISKRLHSTCSLNQGGFSSLGFLWQKRPWKLTNWLILLTLWVRPPHVPCPPLPPCRLLKK